MFYVVLSSIFTFVIIIQVSQLCAYNKIIRHRCRTYLELHYITTGRSANQARPHIPGVLVQNAHISGVLVVVHYLRGESKHRATQCGFGILPQHTTTTGSILGNRSESARLGLCVQDVEINRLGTDVVVNRTDSCILSPPLSC